MRNKTIVLILSAFFAIPVFAAKIPDSAWQKASIKDIQIEEHPRHRHVIVETSEVIYEAIPYGSQTEEAIDKGKLDLAVNGTVECVVEKTKLYLRDPNGSRGRFDIIKKTLKQ